MSNDAARRKFIQQMAAGLAVAVPLPLLARDAPAAARQAPALDLVPQKHVFSIAEFGAVPDGTTLCTKAIQRAVDECAKSGGGKVAVPPGRFLTGAIFLRSHIEFEVMAGATLLGSTNMDDYPVIAGSWEGIDRQIHASMFTGMDLENVAIVGRGTIDGQGQGWWDAHIQTKALRQKLGITEREPENPAGSLLRWPRPRMINFYRCKNVLLRGITIVNSPSWNVHPLLCENVWIEGLTIINPEKSPNTDGIDPESCRNVRICNCYIATGDDCIIMKSGYRYGAGGVPCEDIVVTNCVFGYGVSAVGIGSETAGGVRNVAISNCVVDGGHRGINIKTSRGRGNVIENVTVSNLIMRNLTGTALLITALAYPGEQHPPEFYVHERQAHPVNELTPTVRNLYMSDIVMEGVARAAGLSGLPEQFLEDVKVRNVEVHSAERGFFAEWVRGLTVENVVVNAKGPGFDLKNIQDLELHHVTSKKPQAQQPVIQLTGVEDAIIQFCTAARDTGTFVQLSGTENRGIALDMNKLGKAAKAVAFSDGATEAALEKTSLS
jgi:polygalacturonase